MKKVAIVTGASRGIGAATVQKLIDEGYSVFGIYEKNDEAADKVSGYSSDIHMHRTDIANEGSVKKCITKTIETFGQIDVLVNNAGINLWGEIEGFSLENWNRMLDVNLTAKFLLAKYAIPYLRETKGVIINISSRAGLNEYVFSEFVSYCVTNAAINNFTLALSKELKKDEIRVNAVIPTVTNTDRFKNAFSKQEQEEVVSAGKLAEPAEVANMIFSLVSDATKNGEIFIDERVHIKTDA